MRKYIIKRKRDGINVWNELEGARIDCFKWMDNGYEPRTEAKLFHDGENLYIRFEVHENKITAVYKNMQDPVCRDSCVEFFMRPAADERYLNFETNAIGTMLLGLGTSRYGRISIDADPAVFDIKASVKDAESYSGGVWYLRYKIPFEFLRDVYGDFKIGEGLRANLYKCGDGCPEKHYGMWSEIKLERPDFHTPEFFGSMRFEV